jgi:hypothetical protein
MRRNFYGLAFCAMLCALSFPSDLIAIACPLPVLTIDLGRGRRSNRLAICAARESALQTTSSKMVRHTLLSLYVDYDLAAPVRRAFEHLVRLTGFVEPEHFADFGL